MPGLGRAPVAAAASASASASASPAPSPSRACYNCRRRRLRCDRSRPACRKCSAAGEDCLGYGTVLRWANAPAIRGKLVGQLSVRSPRKMLVSVKSEPESDEAPLSKTSKRPTTVTIQPSLLDPLLNSLHRRARHYVHHFATAVCRDLVSFDQHDRNPFRVIIPLAAEFDFLEAIVVATGAMHMAALYGYQDQLSRPELLDALVAKDKAIRLLRSAIDRVTPANQAMVLAATVFLVNIDLIDSGKGGWQAHIEAATSLLSSLHGPLLGLDPSLMACVDAIAADCLTYRVLGSAIGGVAPASWSEQDLAAVLSVLKRAEAHSYHCCPPEIMHILLSASRLCNSATADPSRVGHALALLHQARSLDVLEWVYSIRGLSDQDDLSIRVSVALAHRAAACLYILLAVPEAAPFPESVDLLVSEVLRNLAGVPVDHIHLKGTIWPTFMVGAQTNDPAQRAWCTERMQAVWTRNPWICPWGYIRTAVQMMQQLWDARDREPAGPVRGNWLLEMQSMREKCLIV